MHVNKDEEDIIWPKVPKVGSSNFGGKLNRF